MLSLPVLCEIHSHLNFFIFEGHILMGIFFLDFCFLDQFLLSVFFLLSAKMNAMKLPSAVMLMLVLLKGKSFLQ